MLITFKTDVGNISMFKDVALRMIKMMGHSETIPGAILAKDLPSALDHLENALAKEVPAPPNEKDNDDENDDNSEPAINLNQRAVPLINLLKNAAEKDCDLLWE